MPRVTVHVQVREYPSSDDVTMTLPLSEDRLSEPDAFTRLDGCAVMGTLLFLHTPETHAKKIIRDRERIAQQLTYAVMKALGEKDLIDGYPKEKRG